MNTTKRLTQAYENALCLSIDKESKLIFFSDVHRGDSSFSDEFAHNQNIYLHAMNYYFSKGFTYIEVGDGDELWEHSDFKHIRGAHDDVYDILKMFHQSNRFYGIYGNHNLDFKDPAFIQRHLEHYFDEFNETYEELLKGIVYHEAIRLKFEAFQRDVFVLHGHQGDFINDQGWRFTKFINRNLWHYLHIIGFTNPASPAKNLHKQHKIEKNFGKWIRETNQMMIIGHTHRPKFPVAGDVPYFNTGSCIFPRNITGLEIERGEIALVEWRIRPDDEGRLSVIRRVLSGPQALSDFLKDEN